MPITLAANGNIRNEVLAYLARKKTENPDYRVVDIGGTANPWVDKYVDTYIDLQPFQTDKELIQGDICDLWFWKRFWEGDLCNRWWNFSICTHTIEDIRNPDLALQGLMSISGAGFIAVPNKQTELSAIENWQWIGYAHHRWIFTIANQELRMLAKTCIANVFLDNPLSWIDTDRVAVAGGMPELSFFWDKGFNYRFLGSDLTDAHGAQEVLELYVRDLAEGL